MRAGGSTDAFQIPKSHHVTVCQHLTLPCCSLYKPLKFCLCVESENFRAPVAELSERQSLDESCVLFRFLSHIYVFSALSMPGEIRNRVGRCSGAMLCDEEPVKVETVPEKSGEKNEGTCQRWFHKICPCCCCHANNLPDDTGIALTAGPGGPKDHKEKLSEEAHETDGEVLMQCTVGDVRFIATCYHVMALIPTNLILSVVSPSSRKPAIGARY